MSDDKRLRVLTRAVWYCWLAAVMLAALLFPVVGGLGVVVNNASGVAADDSAQLIDGTVPGVTTMVDAAGNPIAWLYLQRRWEVPTNRIADTMKLAIVSIEDKRFAEHNGVDLQGTLTGLAGYLQGAVDTRGGSTIEQQYVKNYNLLVNAQTDAERKAAVETTPARKLREIRMALALDKVLTKPEILTRYLNLVSFGNGAYGVQDAARTYFGIDAAQLNWQQAALLAGMVQSTSALNPYTNPKGALDRRNLVLDTMIENVPDQADAAGRQEQQPLGILPQPTRCRRLHRRRRSRLLLRLRAGVPCPRRDQPRRDRPQRLPDPHHAGSQGAEQRQAGHRHRGQSHADRGGQRDERHPPREGCPPGAGDGRQPRLRPEARCRSNRSAPTLLTGRRRRRLDLQGLHHRGGAGHGHGHQRPTRRACHVPGQGLGSSNLPGCPPQTWCVKNAGGYRPR